MNGPATLAVLTVARCRSLLEWGVEGVPRILEPSALNITKTCKSKVTLKEITGGGIERLGGWGLVQ